MRKLALAVVLSTALATTAMANEMPETGLIDAQQVFHMEAAQPLQLAMLSEQEMRETEGAVIPVAMRAGWGAIGGFSSYWGQFSATGQWNTWDMFRSVGGGAVGGLVGVNPALAATAGAGLGGFLSNYRW